MRVFDRISFPAPKHLPTVLGIDEFKGNANKEKYQVLLTDIVDHRPIDILPNRRESTITRYFLQYSREERDKVEEFVSDMFREYDRIGKAVFHNAARTADPFHYTRLIIWALEDIRKREQKRLGKARQKYFKRSKALLIKRFNELSPMNQDAVLRMLELSSDLSTAHYYKEMILKIRDIEDPAEKKKQFIKAADSMKNSGIRELERCADSYYNWLPNILNSLSSPYSNGLTEGCNNKIKVLKRIGFGYRNFDRLRMRVLHSFS
jgi:transposase